MLFLSCHIIALTLRASALMLSGYVKPLSNSSVLGGGNNRSTRQSSDNRRGRFSAGGHVSLHFPTIHNGTTTATGADAG